MSQSKRKFYMLGKPYYDEVYTTYGKPEWDKEYGRAEWAEGMEKCGVVTCPLDPKHRRLADRKSDLMIVLPSPNVGDFVWTSVGECLFTDYVLGLLRQHHITGYQVRPVTISKILGVKTQAQTNIPTLWELVVGGKGGNAHPESGIRSELVCEACGLVRYSSYKNGIIVDERSWDGTDIFTINGYPSHILVTERLKDLVANHSFTNCVLVPSHKLRWPQGVIKPEDTYPQLRDVDYVPQR